MAEQVRLLRAVDVQRKLAVSKSWLYKAVAEDRIPYMRLGGGDGPLRFVESEVDEWLERARAAWRPGDTGAATLRRAS